MQISPALDLTNKEIAAKLGLSENTVKGYVKEILGKMGVRNRVEAISSARARSPVAADPSCPRALLTYKLVPDLVLLDIYIPELDGSL